MAPLAGGARFEYMFGVLERSDCAEALEEGAEGSGDDGEGVGESSASFREAYYLQVELVGGAVVGGRGWQAEVVLVWRRRGEIGGVVHGSGE